jgi:hypothetical protein
VTQCDVVFVYSDRNNLCVLGRDLNGGPMLPWYRSEFDSYDLDRSPPGGLW